MKSSFSNITKLGRLNTPEVNDHNIHTSSKALMCGAHRRRMTLFFVCDEVSWLSTKKHQYQRLQSKVRPHVERCSTCWSPFTIRMDKRRANPCRKKRPRTSNTTSTTITSQLMFYQIPPLTSTRNNTSPHDQPKPGHQLTVTAPRAKLMNALRYGWHFFCVCNHNPSAARSFCSGDC